MRLSVLLSTLIVVAGGALGTWMRYLEVEPDSPPQFGLIPLEIDGFAGDERRMPDYAYDVLHADTTTLRVYQSATSEQLELFVAYFPSQKYGSQIHSPKHCLPGGGWLIESRGAHTMGGSGTGGFGVNRLVISRDSGRKAMFYWFITRSGVVTDEFGLKFDLVKNSLLFRPTDAAFIRITLPIGAGGIDGASDEAARFLDAVHDDLLRALPFGK